MGVHPAFGSERKLKFYGYFWSRILKAQVHYESYNKRRKQQKLESSLIPSC